MFRLTLLLFWVTSLTGDIPLEKNGWRPGIFAQSGIGSNAKSNILQFLKKGGVIMDVVTPEQAIIAERAGACAVMALERVPADIRRDGKSSFNLIRRCRENV